MSAPDGYTQILVVDDDPAILALVESALSRFGYRVESRRSPAEALDFLTSPANAATVIILDWNMPEMSGIDLLRRIKKIEELKYIPVIMLTGRSDPDDVRAGIEAGAYYYLTKPFDRTVLSTLARSAIHHFVRMESLQTEVNEGQNVSGLLNDARFTCRTIEEAEAISRWITRACPDPVGARLGLHELLINAIEHGNLEITYEEKTEYISQGRLREEIERRYTLPEYARRHVLLEFRQTPEHYEFFITDQGAGFDFSGYLELSPERAFSNHGRGIAMARALSFASIEYFHPGNKVRARVARSS